MKFFLFLSLLATIASAAPAPYIVTTYVVLSTYTYEDAFTERSTTIPADIETYTQIVAAPTTPVSALTTITTDSSYTHVTILEVVLPTGTAPSYSSYDTAALSTSYLVPITYTPLPSCTSQNWTFTTNVPVYVPDMVVLPPVTTYISASTQTYAHYNPTPTTDIIAVLNPTDVNAEDLADASSEYMPYYMSYCYTPTTYCSTPTSGAAVCTPTFTYDSSSEYSSSYYGYDYYDNHWLRDLILICVLVPVGWFLIWLLIGLWESWMSFKGLMLGLHRKRGLPYSWCCISILFLCWVGPTYKAKSVEEQAILKERWDAMGKREKLRLWLRWGFRWKYPDCCGEEPEVAKRAFRQGCL